MKQTPTPADSTLLVRKSDNPPADTSNSTLDFPTKPPQPHAADDVLNGARPIVTPGSGTDTHTETRNATDTDDGAGAYAAMYREAERDEHLRPDKAAVRVE